MTTPPKDVLVFFVGNGVVEYDAERSTLGDEQLYDCFRRLPRTRHMCFVKDSDCTQSNCVSQLQHFLESHSKPNDVLIFYYGGHGLKTRFEMRGSKNWLYRDVCQQVEQQFAGHTVWYLIDCCHSGCLVQYIPPTTNKTYLCLASTHGDHGANDEWMMTYCFAQAMKGRLGKEPDASDDDGAPVVDLSQSLCQVLGIMSEHHALILNDWMQFSLIGSGIDPNEPFPFRLPQDTLATTQSSGIVGMIVLFLSSLLFGTAQQITQREQHVEEMQVLDESKWKRLIGVKKGDPVYAKCATATSIKTQSLYRKAICQSDYNATTSQSMEVELEDGSSAAIVQLERNLLPGTYFDFCMPHVVRVHRLLAKRGRYLDARIVPGTRVWAIWEDDDVVYSAVVKTNPPWHLIRSRHDLNDNEYSGPCLWVDWEGEDEWSIIPTCHCIAKASQTKPPTIQQLRRNVRDEAVRKLSSREAMSSHMESMGKRLVVEEKEQVSAFWDGKWYEGTTCTQVPPLDILVQHVHFETIRGNYYCIQWTEEDRCDLLPACLVRKS